MANPIKTIVLGQALVSHGLTAKNAISGVGLATFGFIWQCSDIWTELYSSVYTTWENVSDSPCGEC